MNKRIDEISMLKGAGMLFVINFHMRTISGLPRNVFVGSLVTPVMLLLYFISGYTASVKEAGPKVHLKKNTGRILIPYYQYSAVMIVILAIIYLLVEHRSFAWFADGMLGILFQLQSFHMFDPGSAGVHSMFYPVLIGWFLFQLVVSNLIFIPLLYALKGKNRILKPVTAVLLLLAGAGLYALNLQGLNEEFFPTVCKIFILPNIPGIAGIMMLGNYAAEYSLLDFDSYPVSGKLSALISIPVLAFFIMKDDHRYDFPIGKWGSFGAASYLLTPVFTVALIYALGVLCNLIKKINPVRTILVHFGDNSMEYLMLHLFIAFLIAYIGGFWHDYLSDPVPTDDMRLNMIHFFILIISVVAICYAVIKIKQQYKKKIEKSGKIYKDKHAVCKSTIEIK